MSPFTPADTPSLALFVAVLVFVITCVLGAIHHAYRSPSRTALAALCLAAWLGALSFGVATGWLSRLPLDGLPFFFGGSLLLALVVGLSPLGAALARTTPLYALVLFQAFRLPLELVLHQWAQGGTVPPTMTWGPTTGWFTSNWDVVSGVLALACAPLADRHRTAAWLVNLVGLLLLLNVMRLAVLSSTVPFGWHLEPPLRLAEHLPYALIVPVCVGGALLGHVVLSRALWRPPVPPRSEPGPRGTPPTDSATP